MIDNTELERRRTLWAQGYWEIPEGLDTSDFNFNWRPSSHDRPYIHQFGTQWQRTGGPRFVVPENEGVKYNDTQTARRLPQPHLFNVVVKDQYDVDFDFSWHPDDTEPPFIWVWGNQFIDGREMPTLEYHVPGATERKFVTDQIARLKGKSDSWKILRPLDYYGFDWSWQPDPHEPPYIYVWGNQWHDPLLQPTVEYHVPGATDKKYMYDMVGYLKQTKENWQIKNSNSEFDYSWVPHPHEPPYIYVWGNQWYSAEEDPTVEYHVPGATERKYMHDLVAYLLPTQENWKILLPVDLSSFDFSWRPHPKDPPYIYVWGNQWKDATLQPTVEYHVPGATERKYMDDRIARLKSDFESNKDNWKVLLPVDLDKFDFSWRPYYETEQYIYVWGNQWKDAVTEPTLEYHVPGATQRKYVDDSIAPLKSDFESNKDNWKILLPVDLSSFDFSWRPYYDTEQYIYVWGNQWNDATVEPTVEYHVPGATERKYMSDQVVKALPDLDRWTIPDVNNAATFDFTWRPNPHSPPQIYQWENNGPIYTVPGATEVVLMSRADVDSNTVVNQYYITTTLEDLISEHEAEVFWALNPDLNYDRFDFNWKPTAENFRHINVFGTRLSKDTQTFFINGPAYTTGYREINYVEDVVIDIETQIDMFYVERGNSGSTARFELLKQRYPHIQKTRYLNSWVDTIQRCVKKSTTGLAWILSSDVDYSDFKFDYYPSSWQRNQIHVFGNQWTHWGNTYLVNTETFAADTEYVKVIEHLKNINHVRTKKTRLVESLHDIVYIDHGFNTADDIAAIKERLPNSEVTVLTYTDSYLTTLRNWVLSIPEYAQRQQHWVWVCSSICDYTDFDFTWTCDPFQQQQIHVFASKIKHTRQKFGDTFLLNIAEFAQHMTAIDRLEDYEFKVNYIGHLSTTRKQHPVVKHTYDSQVDAIAELARTFPYYELANQDSAVSCETAVPSLWDKEHRTVIVESTGATQIIVPDCAVDVIKQEVYDYPYIVTNSKLAQSQPLDIMFISNGEPAAEANYLRLLEVAERNKLTNKITRIKDVAGRVASQHAAAHAATTNWYYFMNGKISVNEKFDFNWQPDRLQQAKHYIFTATNPVNGLEYGHQAIVANNRRLTLDTVVSGLDFTLNSLHEVVEMNCGVAVYNTDAWTAWRTAFREAIKLRANTDETSKQRLAIWMSDGVGDYQEFSKGGAIDAVEYYERVDGKLEDLMLSYDWAWLNEYYTSRYS